MYNILAFSGALSRENMVHRLVRHHGLLRVILSHSMSMWNPLTQSQQTTLLGAENSGRDQLIFGVRSGFDRSLAVKGDTRKDFARSRIERR